MKNMDKQYKVASNVKPYQAADHIGKVLGDTAFVLPYFAVGADRAGHLRYGRKGKDGRLTIFPL